MRAHVVKYITGHLLEKAREEFANGNYRKVIHIGATQYPYNVCGASIYYGLSKENSYERVHHLSCIAIEPDVSEKDRAEAIIAEMAVLSRYYDWKLGNNKN